MNNNLIKKERKNKYLRLGVSVAEVMIVIAILSIVLTGVLFVYPSARAKARDQRKRDDLKVYQVALENYADMNAGYYPSYSVSRSLTNMCSTLGQTNCSRNPQTGGADYTYQSNGPNDGSPNATQYVLTAPLEIRYGGQQYIWVACSDGRTGRVLPQQFPNGTCPNGLLP